jgi:hypothetical protein
MEREFYPILLVVIFWIYAIPGANIRWNCNSTSLIQFQQTFPFGIALNVYVVYDLRVHTHIFPLAGV